MVANKSIKSDIDFFSVIGKNGKMCSSFLYQLIMKLRSKEYSISFKAMMSSRNPPPEWEVQEFIPKLAHTSLNHTTGVNTIKEHVNSEYLIVSDVDMAPLCQDWDKKIINRMCELGVDIFGVDHWSSTRTYAGFPIVTFFIVQTKVFLKTNCDFRPVYQLYPNKRGMGCNLMVIKNEEQSKIYQRPIGFELLQDSGWQMPKTFKELGYTGAVLEQIENPRSIIREVGQMWHIDGEPILAHLGKSTKRRQGRIYKWHNAIRNYLNAKKSTKTVL